MNVGYIIQPPPTDSPIESQSHVNSRPIVPESRFSHLSTFLL